jgi:hypothetical protein
MRLLVFLLVKFINDVIYVGSQLFSLKKHLEDVVFLLDGFACVGFDYVRLISLLLRLSNFRIGPRSSWGRNQHYPIRMEHLKACLGQ